MMKLYGFDGLNFPGSGICENIDITPEDDFTLPVKPKRNKQTRKLTKNKKDTKLFNELINSGYGYHSKYPAGKNENPWQKGYLKNIIGSGFYIKGNSTQIRGWYKRRSAKKFRQFLKQSIDPVDGCMYRKICRNINWELC